MTQAKPSHSVKLTINLPAELMEWLDGHLAQGQTRAEAIRRLLERAHRRELEQELAAARELEIDEQYVRSYREHPQEEDMAPWPNGVVDGATVDGQGQREGRDGDAAGRDLVGQPPASLGAPAGSAPDQG
jgi:Arc/MetJ-type ribon-helix-helix transcriptional regulator